MLASKALTTAPPVPKPSAPPSKQTPAYPPAPSVEALEEVEYIQVKKLLRNIRKRPIRRKHRAIEAILKKSGDNDSNVEFFDFESYIA